LLGDWVTDFVVANPISGQVSSAGLPGAMELCLVFCNFRPRIPWRLNCYPSFVMASTALSARINIVGPETTTASVPSRASALLRSAREGDREAWAQLLLPYASSLYRSGLRLTRNVYDAEDVRQETLLKTLARLDQFVGTQTGKRDELQAWVSRIATNASIDIIRRRRESKIFSLDQSADSHEEHPAFQLPSKRVDPEQSVLRRESRRQLATAITLLPPDLRQVCLLMDVLQYSAQEVAERLGISNVAVRLRLFRAHCRLREKVHDSFRPARKSVSVKGNARDTARVSKTWVTDRRRATSCPAMSFACGGD
jgi:RNA polymerase sigma-70 factor (ECF subfamily)